MPDAASITWTSWPLRDEPAGRSAVLLAIVLATSLVAAWQALFLGPLAMLLLLILLAPYFLPTRFEVSDRGVVKRFPLFNRDRRWDVYKRYAIGKDGVFLGTFPHRSRLDSFRGDFVRFAPGVDRQAVLELVRKHVQPTRRLVDVSEPPDMEIPE